jgi:hypothetical protein
MWFTGEVDDRLHQVDLEQLEKSISEENQVPTVPPQPGDDTSPPNAVSLKEANMILVDLITSSGFSSSPKVSRLEPSSISYNLVVSESPTPLKHALELQVAIDFTNPHPKESMMIWTKVPKTLVNNAKTQMQLVRSRFQDFDESKETWLDIPTTVEYASVAKAIFRSVVETDSSGQVVGLSSSEEDYFQLKFGPVGPSGRIILDFLVDSLFSYEKMSTSKECSDIGAFSLIPILLSLPWCHFLDHATKECSLQINFESPRGSSFLNFDENLSAFHYLVTSSGIPSDFLFAYTLHENDEMCQFKRTWSCLPPVSTQMVFWLQVPSLYKPKPKPEETCPVFVKILKPFCAELPLMTCSAPGLATKATLLRGEITVNSLADTPDVPRLLSHVNISDSSGSTGMCCSKDPQDDVRSRFSKILLARVVRRLKSIPVLLEQRVIQPSDIWSESTFVFDHSLLDQHHFLFQVDVLQDSEFLSFLDIFSCGDSKLLVCPKSFSKSQREVFLSLKELVDKIQKSRPSGATAFAIPARSAISQREIILSKAKAFVGGKPFNETTFVSFDTDGGNNTGECYEAIREMASKLSVCGGCVCGFGSWVDQNCASQVASILGGPALLGLYVPEIGSLGSQNVFREEFCHWLDCIASRRGKLIIHGGAVSRGVYDAVRIDNGATILGFEIQPEFDMRSFKSPDISSTEFTGAVLDGILPGQKLSFFCLSLHDNIEKLMKEIQVKVNDEEVSVSCIQEDETLNGVFLAFRWINFLDSFPSSSFARCNSEGVSHGLVTRLLEDLSFSWNLPLPSGATALIGRTKTSVCRRAIHRSQQPDEPVRQPCSVPRHLLKKQDKAVNLIVKTLTGDTSSCLNEMTFILKIHRSKPKKETRGTKLMALILPSEFSEQEFNRAAASVERLKSCLLSWRELTFHSLGINETPLTLDTDSIISLIQASFVSLGGKP